MSKDLEILTRELINELAGFLKNASSSLKDEGRSPIDILNYLIATSALAMVTFANSAPKELSGGDAAIYTSILQLAAHELGRLDYQGLDDTTKELVKPTKINNEDEARVYLARTLSKALASATVDMPDRMRNLENQLKGIELFLTHFLQNTIVDAEYTLEQLCNRVRMLLDSEAKSQNLH